MRIARAVLAAPLAVLLAGPAAAAPLDKDACEKLKSDQAGMTAAREHLAKGAEWGKANLSADQLQAVARYIDIEEQLAFRCVERKSASAEKSRAKSKAKRASKAKSDDGNDDNDEEVRKPAAKPAAKSASKSPSSTAKTAEAASSKPASRARKPKANADDAYVPPKKPSADE